MCGIFFSVRPAHPEYDEPGNALLDLLRRRGPDAAQEHKVTIRGKDGSSLQLTFLSTVLALRGEAIVSQPLVDASTGSVLCWNGEAWSRNSVPVAGNDSLQVFDALLSASHYAKSVDTIAAVLAILHALIPFRGPHAFVYYDALHKLLIYGRDCLGRRSLVSFDKTPDHVTLSSICDPSIDGHWTEVEADGIYYIDLSSPADPNRSNEIARPSAFERQHVPYLVPSRLVADNIYLPLPFPRLNKSEMREQDAIHDISQATVDTLRRFLHKSLQLRSIRVREHHTTKGFNEDGRTGSGPVAVLFSGGLDCTVLARMLHDILPAPTPIDLLNVAFENPRAHRSLGSGMSPYESCPDRMTANQTVQELRTVCPQRSWNLVKINVPYEETTAHRDVIIKLMRPHNTEMDLSIALALYFASRGEGVVDGPAGASTYLSHSHVLLSGLGADELFGGYQRHATAFSRRGFQGLVDELELDINRLGKRNLGRDDRVMSHWGKEVRFPYLDEDLLGWALAIPVWEKCGFDLDEAVVPTGGFPTSMGDKRILRLLASDLGMTQVAKEKKRAIQFGARTAKMEAGNTKGTQVLS